MKIKNKLKKLINNPKLFFSDLVLKHSERIPSFLQRVSESEYKYTIITAVYNSEKYLNKYFHSIVNQTLLFKNNIHIIIIDDGSTDASAEIVKSWAKKYPKNISYYYQENSGPASARNLGLNKVRTKWVTFIDSDDFVSRNYFRNINLYLLNNRDIGMLSSNVFFYNEKENTFVNKHPLNYRFHDKTIKKYPFNNLGENIQISVNSCIFNYDIIARNSLFFDERVTPSFEDGKFVCQFLLCKSNQKIVFFPHSIYFYRKRTDSSSILDNEWKIKSQYNEKLDFGILQVLELYKEKKGYIPIHIQKTVIYIINIYISKLINNDIYLGILNSHEKETFIFLLKKIVSYLEPKIIYSYSINNYPFYKKLMLLCGLRGEIQRRSFAYIDRFNDVKNEIFIFLPLATNSDISFYLDNEEIYPTDIKILPKKIGNTTLCNMVYCWLPITRSKKLLIKVNNISSKISVDNKKYHSLSTNILYNHFNQHTRDKKNLIIMDRDNQADDNGEHFYRYIRREHPERSVYFAIRKTANDWKRLKRDNFNLLDFGSRKYLKILTNDTSRMVSSQISPAIHNYYRQRAIRQIPFVFLQHGVIKDDLSSWLNNKKSIEIFVTTTTDEFNSISANNSPYIFTRKVVIQTGQPRHDDLIRLNQSLKEKPRQILVMPTWRKNIIGDFKANTDDMEKNPTFTSSRFFKNWNALINHPKFRDIVTKYHFEVVFAPHKLIQPYLDDFKIPDFVKIWKQSSDISIQELFTHSSFMITDYSSVAFDMAILDKSTLYFQFDEDEIYSGVHTYKKSYFDYSTHGFGPKTNNLDELLAEVDKICSNDGCISQGYLQRIKNTFKYQDTNNCERVYQGILKLEKNIDPSFSINPDILISFAKLSIKSSNTTQAISRCEKIQLIGNNLQQKWANSMLLKLYYQNGQLRKLHGFLIGSKNFIKTNDSIRAWANLQILQKNWGKAISLLSKVENKTSYDYFNLIRAAAFGQSENFSLICDEILHANIDIHVFQEHIIPIYELVYQKHFLDVLTLLKTYPKNIINRYKFDLLRSTIYRNLGEYSQARAAWQKYWDYSSHNDCECRVEMAYTALPFEKYYENGIKHIRDGLEGAYEFLPLDLCFLYSQALLSIGDMTEHAKVESFLHKKYASKISTQQN